MMFVKNPQTGQFAKIDPTVKGFGWRWTWNKSEATSFTHWSEAAKIGKGIIVDNFDIIMTRMRAWRTNVL
jgi:hypothetical protein